MPPNGATSLEIMPVLYADDAVLQRFAHAEDAA